MRIRKRLRQKWETAKTFCRFAFREFKARPSRVPFHLAQFGKFGLQCLAMREPKIGDDVPDTEIWRRNGTPEHLYNLLGEKPAVLIFGSFT